MNAALDFAALPPEINSLRIYTGPGSAPMLAAASAWNGLATELRDTAFAYQAELSALIGEEWFGPAWVAMAAAALPHVAWLRTTAAQAEQTAAQAEAAVAAFEAAFAAMVPPPVIAANRAELAELVVTNILGQNTPAIAATEAQYLQIWAQDAATMYGYAASSAAATDLFPFTGPRATTAPGGLAAQAVAITQSGASPAAGQQGALGQLMAAVPSALQALSGSSRSGSFWADWGPNANVWNTLASTGLMVPGSTFAPFLGMLGGPTARGAGWYPHGRPAAGGTRRAAGRSAGQPGGSTLWSSGTAARIPPQLRGPTACSGIARPDA